MCYSIFQFHKGSIKTTIGRVTIPCTFAFQFHKGSIKTKVNVDNAYFPAHFNSIKVRLRHFFAYGKR